MKSESKATHTSPTTTTELRQPRKQPQRQGPAGVSVKGSLWQETIRPPCGPYRGSKQLHDSFLPLSGLKQDPQPL